jgi:hypothetical protein
MTILAGRNTSRHFLESPSKDKPLTREHFFIPSKKKNLYGRKNGQIHQNS